MKIHPQIIYKNNQPEFIVLPVEEYEKILAILEDQQEIEEIKNHLTSPEETFPMELVIALAEGNNPIKLFRDYRKLSQSSLAEQVKVSKQYISQLENGERAGTTKVLKSIAKALHVDLEDIARSAE